MWRPSDCRGAKEHVFAVALEGPSCRYRGHDDIRQSRGDLADPFSIMAPPSQEGKGEPLSNEEAAPVRGEPGPPN